MKLLCKLWFNYEKNYSDDRIFIKVFVNKVIKHLRGKEKTRFRDSFVFLFNGHE